MCSGLVVHLLTRVQRASGHGSQSVKPTNNIHKPRHRGMSSQSGLRGKAGRDPPVDTDSGCGHVQRGAEMAGGEGDV